MKQRSLTCFAVALLAALPALAALPSGFVDELVTAATGPTAIAFTPDGRLWMSYYDFDYPPIEQGLCWYDGVQVGLFPAPPGGEPQWGGLPHAAIEDLEVRAIPGGYELWMSCISRGIAVLTVKE